MKFDPTSNYGDKDLSEDETLAYWKFGELIKTLITIASDADRQKEITGIGATADEMALDFDTYFTLSTQSYDSHNLLTIAQKDELIQLDQFFEERSGNKSPDFWDDSKLEISSDWEEVRQRAKAILKMLDMDDLALIFDREEKYEMTDQGERIIMQSTRTRIIKKNR